MKCDKCSSTNIGTYFEDVISCTCGTQLELNVYICFNCKFAWRVCNGETIDLPTLTETAAFDENPDILGPILKALVDDLFEDDIIHTSVIDCSLPTKTMSDIVHRCIRCSAISYEIAEDIYKCPSCDFEWEVM